LIYVDTSVVLAQILSEDVAPPEAFWAESLVSSRLLEYETWNRLHAHAASNSHGAVAHAVLAELSFLELSHLVLSRALDAFPVPLRTLDALHLASADYLRRQGQNVQVASYDERLRTCAEQMGFSIWSP